MKESLQSLVLVALNALFAPGLHQWNIVAACENRLMLSHFQGLMERCTLTSFTQWRLKWETVPGGLLSGNFIQENCGFHDPAENLLCCFRLPIRSKVSF